MVQKRGTKAINKLCVREILGLSFVCGAYFFEFRGWKQGRYACALPISRLPNFIPLNVFVINIIFDIVFVCYIHRRMLNSYPDKLQ